AIMDSMGVTSRTIAADESVVAKKDQTISGVSDSYSKTYGDADFTLNAKSSGDGIISYSSSDTSVVTVTSAGKVSIKKAGSAEIEISATETATCNPASKKVKITVDPKKVTPTIDAIPDQDYTGSAITPEVKVHGDGKVLSKGYYDVTYKNNVDPGTATVTVTLKGNYTGSASTTFKINGELTKPGKVIIKTATAGTSYVKLSWNAASDAVGYRVYRYDDTKKKYVSVKTLSDTSYKDTGLSAAQEYKYKVRAYNKINSTMVWGSYSNVKSILTKPKTPTISKVTKSTNAVKLTWKKVGCTGYQVQKYDAAKKKWVTVKTIKSAKTVSYKVTGLKKNTSYTLRVRAYKTSGSLKSYSAWSKKTVKTKK
ncbi:MAG: fibronectin type III domain-containing protein, partial [Ruminococcus sp.]|nr:fibronectin type III domain-containing protein [Ruminococcus sp.]